MFTESCAFLSVIASIIKVTQLTFVTVVSWEVASCKQCMHTSVCANECYRRVITSILGLGFSMLFLVFKCKCFHVHSNAITCTP